MHALQERVKLEDSKLITESQVLDYLKDNKQLAKNLKMIFDYEFQDLANRRRDIIASWEHYDRFQALF